MKIHWSARRSDLSRGGRVLAALLFAALAGAAPFASTDPAWMAWAASGTAFAGMLAVLLWRDREPDTRSEEEILLETARDAVRAEANRLDTKRVALERVLMAYGEWMEFPDYVRLQAVDWRAEDRIAADERVASLIDDEADLMLKRFSSGEYWSEGRFVTRKLLLDLFSFVESVARVHKPEADRPLLETDLESILKAVNRSSLQIILLLEELPLLEVKEMNLRKMSDGIRKASTVYRKYEELDPVIRSLRYVWQGSKVFIAANPVLGALWLAGSEVAWRGGRRFAKRAVDVYLLSLVRQSLGIIAWETSGIYDPSHRYRSPDWVYGVELAHLLSRFDATQEVLREAFRELSALPLRSSYDRIFLYRCIAHNVSPKPKHFAQPELLDEEVRRRIERQLIDFYERNISANADAENPGTLAWREGLGERLGLV